VSSRKGAAAGAGLGTAACVATSARHRGLVFGSAEHMGLEMRLDGTARCRDGTGPRAHHVGKSPKRRVPDWAAG